MSTDSDGGPTVSLFSRVIGRQRHPLVTVTISLLLVLAPLAAAYLDGLVSDLFRYGHWRIMLSPAAVTIYMLVVAPILERFEAQVLDALRPVILVDRESFDRLVASASRISPASEAIAVGLGAAFGLFLGQTWFSDSDAFWLRLVVTLSCMLMFGLLGWTIYVSVAATRLISALHAQPMRIDIFDTKPFRPVGRQSLIIALVFIGGIVLGSVFGLDVSGIMDWRNWVFFSVLALVPVLIFFLNMRPTHRVLSAEKKRELANVQQHFLLACRTLLARIDAEERQEGTGIRTGTLAAGINALVAYEERLQAASTWPYDTAMLRTLFFSVIIPGVAALARVIGEMVME